MRILPENIITIKEAVGLDVHLLPDDRWLFTALHVKLVKGKLIKVKEYLDHKGLEHLQKQLPKNVPVVVTVNGKGILVRETDVADVNLINQLFPGGNPNDFYVQSLKINEARQYSFICRKSLIGQVLDRLKAAQIIPVYISAGAESFHNILPFVTEPDLELKAPSYTVKIVNKEISSVVYLINPENQKTLSWDIGGYAYQGGHVNLLATLLDVLLKPANWQEGSILTPAIEKAREEYKYNRLFNFSKWAILSVTLVLLLINFFVFNYYFNKNKELLQQTNMSSGRTQAGLETARSDSSYAFFTGAGWNKNTRHGYYADRIAALAPPSLKLTLLQTAPMQESVGSGDFVFANNKIVVSGTSADPTDLEVFSRSIKNIPGAETVSLTSYLYKKELDAAVFTIEITVAR
ncbi:MAG: hypothetical protein J7539_16040 [Niabella sp.]|nr:hypothetical protein [Niabella sp.]